MPIPVRSALNWRSFWAILLPLQCARWNWRTMSCTWGVSMTMPGLRSRSPCQRFWQRPSVCAHRSEPNQKNARQWHRRSSPGCAPQTSVQGHGAKLAVRPGSVRPNCWRSTGHARCCRARSRTNCASCLDYQSPRGTGYDHPDSRPECRPGSTALFCNGGGPPGT